MDTTGNTIIKNAQQIIDKGVFIIPSHNTEHSLD
jgi:hypothetical protein